MAALDCKAGRRACIAMAMAIGYRGAIFCSGLLVAAAVKKLIETKAKRKARG